MERFGKAGYGEDVPTMMYAGIFGATIVGVRWCKMYSKGHRCFVFVVFLFF